MKTNQTPSSTSGSRTFPKPRLKLHCNYHVTMKPLRFEWDEYKAKSNLKKHKVNFEEAKTVFHDENARLIPDPEHSEEEARFILMG